MTVKTNAIAVVRDAIPSIREDLIDQACAQGSLYLHVLADAPEQSTKTLHAMAQVPSSSGDAAALYLMKTGLKAAGFALPLTTKDHGEVVNELVRSVAWLLVNTKTRPRENDPIFGEIARALKLYDPSLVMIAGKVLVGEDMLHIDGNVCLIHISDLPDTRTLN